jgi:predicted small integral membrane protein
MQEVLIMMVVFLMVVAVGFAAVIQFLLCVGKTWNEARPTGNAVIFDGDVVLKFLCALELG